MSRKKLRFGTSYCPYAKSADTDMKYWDRDFKTMKELNFNTVRCFVAWDRIEQEEGKLDFTKTDYVFELAAKHGLEVILNIGGVFDCYGGIYPPRWLIYDYKCQTIIENPNVEKKTFGPLPMLCPDDPVYTSKAEEFTIAAIKRYAENSELCGWNVWNEAAVNTMCYCPETLKLFRNWLKVRYSDNLDELNRRWGTEFPVNYRTWEMIEPGLGAGFLSGGVTARLDWMRFNQHKVENWINNVNRLVKEYDQKNRPTTSNVVTTAVEDIRKLNSPDIWSQNRNLDIAGFSFYTQKLNPADCSYMLSNVRGSSADPDKNFWILETSAGQQFNPEIYPGDSCDAANRTASNWQSILHGATTILLWKFGGRVSDNQSDFYNLTGWDGGITERALNNAAFAKQIMEHEELFLNRKYVADIAILASAEGILFNIVDDTLSSYGKSMASRFGAYTLMRDLRMQTDIISETQIREGRLSEYKVLIIPWCEIMDQKLADKIKEFVHNGGRVISDRSLNMKDEYSMINMRAPGNGLQEVFGAYMNDMLLTGKDESISINAGKIKVLCHRHSILHPLENAEIAGKYKNGNPAVIKHSFGQGSTLWFGTDIFMDYRLSADSGTSSIISEYLKEAGLESDYEISGSADNVEFGALSGADGKKIHFILNMNDEERTFSFRVKSAEGNLKDILGGSICHGGHCKVTMKAWQSMILV